MGNRPQLFPTFQVSSNGRSEFELDFDGAGNGARTRDLNFGNNNTAVFCGLCLSTPSEIKPELSRAVPGYPPITVVKIVVKATCYPEKKLRCGAFYHGSREGRQCCVRLVRAREPYALENDRAPVCDNHSGSTVHLEMPPAGLNLDGTLGTPLRLRRVLPRDPSHARACGRGCSADGCTACSACHRATWYDGKVQAGLGVSRWLQRAPGSSGPPPRRYTPR